MRKHTLYCYVEGSAFGSEAEVIFREFKDFIGLRLWKSGEAWPVNQNREKEWELGMNLELPNPNEEPDGWFDDVEEIAVFTRNIALKTGLEFVLGIHDNQGYSSEDLFSINGGPLDIESLKKMVGVNSAGG